MKALTLTQPWATLVAIGAKKIETRSWNTTYRGQIAIHAAKGFPKWARDICAEHPFGATLARADILHPDGLPLGVIVATCELVNVVRITKETDVRIGVEWYFGDYAIGRYMWFLENVVVLPEPIPAKGALSLWEWGGVEHRMKRDVLPVPVRRLLPLE